MHMNMGATAIAEAMLPVVVQGALVDE